MDFNGRSGDSSIASRGSKVEEEEVVFSAGLDGGFEACAGVSIGVLSSIS